MLISIIIPIYNAKDYLQKCLNSVIGQTYKDLEIILINDGSTDESGKICDVYANIDNRIIVIHKNNEGVSAARNYGLKIAKGKYIGFIDPDDWLEHDMIDYLYNLITKYNADMSICGFYKENPDGKLLDKYRESNLKLLNGKETINLMLDNGYVWNKLFSKKIIDQYRIKFDENIAFCEDMLFCCQYLMKAKKVVYENKPKYHYIIHGENITKSQFSFKKVSSLDALNKIIDLIRDNKEININRYINNFMHMNISLLLNSMNQKSSDFNTRKYLKKNLFKYRINSLTDRNVKLSCAIGRFSIYLLYMIWKSSKMLTDKK